MVYYLTRKADYEDFALIHKYDITKYIEQVKLFIETAKKIVKGGT